ncbi:MAG: DNA mismatch repair protein MutS [Muribaculaceae bacterium]|nr:DNA mismatch repair protein MutS [Muribaculaceae bacterium]
MQLKNVIESPCGLRFMLDELELQSGFARRWLLDSPMMMTSEEILASYAKLASFVTFISRVDKIHLDTLLFKLQALKDIRTTIKNLHHQATLDDIELFEVKHLAILSTDVAKLLRQQDMAGVVEIPDLNEVISILDPDGLKIATFYIYDSYCAQLKDLRNQMRQQPEQQDDLLLQAAELEDGVRKDLSQRLHTHAAAIEQAQLALAKIDIYLAKAMQMRQMGLTIPELSPDETSSYRAMFHPQVKAALAAHGKEFQPVDISFGQQPTLITGANMGGKTVVLKTLTLCQLLFQFGFGIPAASAQIAVKDEIHFCIGDEQSVEKGLSSFAAEMKNIDAVIKASREDKKLLALIDEPARTTNPTEGTALVSALLKVLEGRNMSLVMTTHYDIEPGDARCLRVKGFVNGEMDYRLVEVHDGEVPHEALNIAQSLGIDSEWIETARAMLGAPNVRQEDNH